MTTCSKNLEDFMPHQSPMILLHKLIEWGPEKITAKVMINEDVPFCRDGIVPAYIGLEYMAQACALWSGLRASEKRIGPRVGFLLGTRNFNALYSDFERGDELLVIALLKYEAEGMGHFECYIQRSGETVATAHVSVFQPDGDSV